MAKSKISKQVALDVSLKALDLMEQVEEIIKGDMAKYNQKETAGNIILGAQTIAKKLKITLDETECKSGPIVWHVHHAKRTAALVSGMVAVSNEFDTTPAIKANLEKIIAHMNDVIVTAKF